MGRRLRDFTIGQKLWVIVAVGLIGFLLSAAYSLKQLHDNLLAERQAQAQSVVEAAFAVLEHYGAEVSAGRSSNAEAQHASLQVLKRMRYGADNYLWINDDAANILLHPARPDLVGQNLADMVDAKGKRIIAAFVDVARDSGQGFVEYVWPKPFEDRPVRKIAFVKGYPRWSWVLGSGAYLDDFESEMAVMIRKTLGTTLALAVLLCLAAALLVRSVTRDLHRAVDVAHQLAQGDMTVRIDVVNATETGLLFGALKEMIEHHSRVLKQVHGTAAALLASVDRFNAIARSVLRGSRNQVTSASQSALAAQHMFASIEANHEVARRTERLAARAVREANEGRDAVMQAATEVQLISEKILVIHEIAHQTTLLAHDFSIEETRTGAIQPSAAVVEHVQTLYEQTRTAAQEIGMLAGSSAALVNKACRYLEAIVVSIEKAAHEAQTVCSAADEATTHARQVAASEAQLQSISQEHATAAARLSAEAADVRRHAQKLQDLMGYFTLDGTAGLPNLEPPAAEPSAPADAPAEGLGRAVDRPPPGAL